MKLKLWILLTLVMGVLLTACNAGLNAGVSTETQGVESVAPKVVKETSLPLSEPDSTTSAAGYEMAVDKQGAVQVFVTPLNLQSAVDTLDFDVAMETHSVDLTMNLTELAILTTDNGRSVAAVGWDAAPGGHHVSGQLSFPALLEGSPVLENATSLTLTIAGVDAPTRTFSWALAQ